MLGPGSRRLPPRLPQAQKQDELAATLTEREMDMLVNVEDAQTAADTLTSIQEEVTASMGHLQQVTSVFKEMVTSVCC